MVETDAFLSCFPKQEVNSFGNTFIGNFESSEGLYICISLYWAPGAVQIILLFLFYVLRSTFWPKMCFRRDFEVNFCHCEWSCGFLMMFLQTCNGQIIKFFNLKGIRWENKILQTAQVGQNKHFWQKRNKNCW